MNFLSNLNNLFYKTMAAVNVSGGLEQAKTSIISEFKTIVSNVVIPIILLVLVIILICQIAAAAARHKQGLDWQDKLIPIALVVAAIIVVGSAGIWMWTMIGV